VRWAKARWRIEQDYEQLKGELGLDHFEGRRWLGWHHHVTMTTMAYGFLVRERLRPLGSKKTIMAKVASAACATTDVEDSSLGILKINDGEVTRQALEHSSDHCTQISSSRERDRETRRGRL